MKLYYLSIPIVIGIIAGGFLGTYGINSEDSEIVTSAKLIENGSPFLGNADAPITVLERGIISVHFVINSIKTHWK